MVYVNVHVSRHLKEELAWAIDKRLRVNCNKMLFKMVILLETKNIVALNLKQYYLHCYVRMSTLVMYSN